MKSIQEIKETIDIADYMTSRGYTFKSTGAELYCKEISGFCINTNKNRFYDHKNEVGGSIIDLVMHLDKVGIAQAVSSLRDDMPSYQKKTISNSNKEQPKPLPFSLPEVKKGEADRLSCYLNQKRAISKDVISSMMERNMLYEDAKYGNCVFVGYDYDNIAKYASVRSTGDKKMTFDIKGSSKKIGWFVNNKSKNLMTFESAIDAMSVMTLLGNKQNDYSYLSQGGAGTIKTLEYHLVNNPEIDKLYLCYDNDDAGKHAINRALDMLNEIGFKGKVVKKQPQSKDFNEDLQMKTNIKEEHRWKASYQR